MKKEILVTIVGMRYYLGIDVFDPGKKYVIRKDKINEYDCDAIEVMLNKRTRIGFIANSHYTSAKGTYSAGRLYDKIRNKAVIKVLAIVNNSTVIAKVVKGIK